jgi:glycosyltransferase involved in cell wall biosynthesis
MDMRDPWSLQQRLTYGVASPLWFRIAERDEKAAVARAALVVCNTEPAADAMRARYPAKRVITAMNGIDEGELPPSTVGTRFILGYAGSIYLDRDPRPLFRAVAGVVRQRSLDPGRFGVEFIGYADRYEGQSLEDIARDEGVADFVRIGAPRPHHQAMEFLASCTMLVSLPQDSSMAIPSKVFEYLRFPAWLLAMAEPGSATARVLAGTGADVVPPADVGAIAAAIGHRYDAFAAGERPAPLGTDPGLTRRHQGGLLLDALEELTGR